MNKRTLRLFTENSQALWQAQDHYVLGDTESAMIIMEELVEKTIILFIKLTKEESKEERSIHGK